MASNAASPATCKLCSELFTDPRMLPCLHSFCNKCLQKLLEEHGTDEKLKCPTCKISACIPSVGVNGFPQDLRQRYEAEIALYEEKVKSSSDQSCDRCIKSGNGPAVCFCCSCSEFLCKVCKEDHQTCRKTLNHELVDIIETSATKKEGNFPANIARKPMFCALHNDEKLKFFCETCQTLVCCDCIIPEHSGHKYDRIEKVAEKEKNDLLSVLGDAEAAKASIDDALAQVEKTKQRVQPQKKSVNESITATFKELYDTLHSREVALLAKSEEVSLGKVAALTIQHEDLKMVRDKLADTYQIILAAELSYLPAEMLSLKTTMKERLQDLLKQFRECHLDPRANDMIHSKLQVSTLSDAIAAIGTVTGGCCPSTTTATLYIPRAVVGRERKVVITAQDENGKPFPHGGESITGAFSLMGSIDSPVETRVADNGDGIYTLSFTPQAPGEHELRITISSYPIKGSPFVISARKERAYTSLFQSAYQRSFSTSGQPWDVAVDGCGDVFIAEYGQHCISVFTQSGASKRTIGSYGSGDGQFYSPSAIAIRGDVMYITEIGNCRIQKLSTKGEFISKFGEPGSGDGQLTTPRGICLDPNGMIFVGDHSNNRVCVFNADGTFAYNITGDAGEGSNLTNPWGVAFDPSGNLHIANYSSSCIKVFTANGQYVTQYGSGQVSYAAGIAIDEEGYAFVTSYNTNYIFVFDPQHKLLTSRRGFSHPVGITFDKEGLIYVADSNLCQVKKY